VRYLQAQGVPFFQIYDSIFSGTHRWYSAVLEHVDRLKARFPVIGHDVSRYLCQYGHALAVVFRKRDFDEFWDIYDKSYDIKIGVSDPLAEQQGQCKGRFQNLFDNQPGDFILASREAWHRITGPPMLPEKLFIDILVLCRLARYYRQVVLSHPCFFYHQAHANATPRVEFGRHDSELNEGNIWDRCCRPFDKFESEALYNTSTWGFSDMRIPESIVHYWPTGERSGDWVVRELH